ncbi:hypothetical protein Taro_008807 [Colocasia esculenta]|uniref:Uncharacterized protein n=1 Tax=Colocasia esculenta TaxID=4460 RepID=A0A843TUR2_COLES|nr:hypothetical protein [Colocasia esculenta]
MGKKQRQPLSSVDGFCRQTGLLKTPTSEGSSASSYFQRTSEPRGKTWASKRVQTLDFTETGGRPLRHPPPPLPSPPRLTFSLSPSGTPSPAVRRHDYNKASRRRAVWRGATSSNSGHVQLHDSLHGCGRNAHAPEPNGDPVEKMREELNLAYSQRVDAQALRTESPNDVGPLVLAAALQFSAQQEPSRIAIW